MLALAIICGTVSILAISAAVVTRSALRHAREIEELDADPAEEYERRAMEFEREAHRLDMRCVGAVSGKNSAGQEAIKSMKKNSDVLRQWATAERNKAKAFKKKSSND